MVVNIKGYTAIVKIAESALKGDKERARKYIEKYVEMYPEGDLTLPFTRLLNGENSPIKLEDKN